MWNLISNSKQGVYPHTPITLINAIKKQILVQASKKIIDLTVVVSNYNHHLIFISSNKTMIINEEKIKRIRGSC